MCRKVGFSQAELEVFILQRVRIRKMCDHPAPSMLFHVNCLLLWGENLHFISASSSNEVVGLMLTYCKYNQQHTLVRMVSQDESMPYHFLTHLPLLISVPTFPPNQSTQSQN